MEKKVLKHLTVASGRTATSRMTAEAVRDACERVGVVYKAGDEERVVSYIGSDETVDRYGDIIRVAGWDTEQYEKNPVILWGHNSGEPPIGTALSVRKEERGLVFDVLYADTETGQTVERLARAGHVRAVSVGFLPIKSRFIEDKEEMQRLGMKKPGMLFEKQELLELSNVSVPANPSALKLAYPGGEQIVRRVLELPTAEAALTEPVAVAGLTPCAQAEIDRLFLSLRFADEIAEPVTRWNAGLKAWLLSQGVAVGTSASELEAVLVEAGLGQPVPAFQPADSVDPEKLALRVSELIAQRQVSPEGVLGIPLEEASLLKAAAETIARVLKVAPDAEFKAEEPVTPEPEVLAFDLDGDPELKDTMRAILEM